MQNQRDDIAPTLPSELLSFIFLECVTADSTDNFFSRPSRKNAPLNLSWVNSQWRQIALSTPKLWTSIALPNSRTRNTNPNPTTGDAEILKLYLSRSGKALPLSIALDYGGTQSRNEMSHRDGGSEETEREAHVAGMHCLSLILNDVRQRWRVLVVRCRAPEALTIFMSSLVLGAPFLEHLLLSSTPRLNAISGSESETVERMVDPTRCPQLKSVVLQCPHLRVNPFLPDDTPLTHLSSLVIHASTLQSDAFTWLQASPNLETFSIQFVDASAFALPHARPLTLPHLTRLSLSCLSGADQEASNPSSFLHLLCLPALRIFELTMDGSLGTNQGWPHAVELLRRSGPEPGLGPSLDELELLGTPMTASELLDILNLVPGLKKLTIDDELASDEVFRPLSGPGSADTESESVNPDHDRNEDLNLGLPRVPLCPELETIVLHACSASLPVLASMVSSRCYRTPQDHCDESNGDSLSSQIRHPQADGELRYRTLKALELVYSYRSLPSVIEHPMFLRCQKDGLKIVQRPSPVSEASTREPREIE